MSRFREAIAARAFDYSVEDYYHGPGIGATERHLSITWLFRNFTVKWSGPLSRKAIRRQAL